MKKLANTSILTLLLAGCGAETGPSTGAQGAELGTIGRTPTALTGDYRLSGNVEAIGRLTVDIIDVRMADAAARLDAARAEGAACELAASNTYRCTKTHPAEEVPSTSLDAIAAQNPGLYASFGDVTASPSLVSQGDSLAEWQISQGGTSSAGPFSSYRYLQLDGDLTKIVLPNAASADESSSLELILKDAAHLGKWASHVVTESRWRWHEDMALVILAN
jgi:hypothetical protein